MAQLLNEDYTGASVINEDKTQLPTSVLCRVRYPICNIGILNRNNRRYDKEVFEGVLGKEDIQDKLKLRVLFGEIEHPANETVTRLDRPITHTTHQIIISENDKKVYADLDVLDTPAGNLIYTLLKAKCDVGVSTRAEGELEEAIDETTGNKYFRVLPEAYVLRAIDFTADESTFGALPIKIEHNIVKQIKNGVGEGKVDRTLARAILENFRSKAAIQLCESLQTEEDMEKTKNEGKAPEAGANETDIIQALTEKDKNEEVTETPVETTPELPPVPPVEEIPAPVVPPISVPVPEPTLADKVADIAQQATDALATAAAVVAKAEEIVGATAPVIPSVVEPIPAPPVEELPPVEILSDEELGESLKRGAGLGIKELVGRLQDIEDNLKSKDISGAFAHLQTVIAFLSKAVGNTEIEESKLNILRSEYIQECAISESLKKEKKDLEESSKKNLGQAQEYTKKLTEALKKIVRLGKVNEELMRVNETLKQEKVQIKESSDLSFIKNYVARKTQGSGFAVPSNVLTLLESCKTLDEVDSQFEKVSANLLEATLHSSELTEIVVPIIEGQESNKIVERINENVKSALKGMN